MQRLIEEINAQKALFSAETGQVCPRLGPVDSRELLDDLIGPYANHGLAEGKELRVHPRVGATQNLMDMWCAA